MNPEFLPFEPRTVLSVDDAARLIMSTDSIEGVTYTGGEPFAQAEAICLLTDILKDHGLSIMAYSGYTFHELKATGNSFILRLLSQLDILIDGPYEETCPTGGLWRGSANQKVHFLSSRYRMLDDSVEDNREIMGRQVEFILGREGYVATGIWLDDFIRKLNTIMGRNHERT